MWDDPFDTFMLEGENAVVVNCPDEDSEREFAAILGALGISYPDGVNIFSVQDVWESYRDGFCYFIGGRVARRGPKAHADYDQYRNYKNARFTVRIPTLRFLTPDSMQLFLRVMDNEYRRNVGQAI